MCKHAVKNLPYLLRYVLDQYKTQQMCDIVISENGRTLNSLPGCYNNKQLSDKAVDNYLHALEFVPDCYMTQKCVIKLSILNLLELNMFLINLRLNKCVMKPLMVFYQH